MQPLYAIAYLSSATHLFKPESVETLLEQSRTKNASLDITGMLLYCDGNFMQYIEGPLDNLVRLYESICKDRRHRDIIELFMEPIETREFADWAMAYRTIPHQEFIGLSKAEWLIKPGSPSEAAPSTDGRMLLREFWKNTMRRGI